MKKEGKKKDKKDIKKKGFNKKTLIILILTIITLIVLFLIFKNLPVTTNVIEKPYTPENCSNESIKKAWEAIFKGSSQNLTIIGPPANYLDSINYSDEESGLEMHINPEIFKLGDCPLYSIYQVNGTNIKMLMGLDAWFFMDMNMVYAINGNFKPEIIQNITSYLKNSSEGDENYFSILVMGSEKENSTLLPRKINTTEQAKSQFESVFKINSSNWTSEFSQEDNLTVYSFNESEEMENITLFGEPIDPLGSLMIIGMVFGNTSLDTYVYSELSIFGILEILEKKFANLTSPINTSLKNITIQVNNSKFELLGDYNGKKKVEILENNKTIIETEINFTREKYFDWTKIILKKQDITSTKGYVIINGLNFTKNITVDKLNNESKSVCVKNKEINSISEISEKCNSTYEYLIKCPGNISNTIINLTCRISGDRFIVTGLTHSAVLEIIPPKNCIQNWECTEWEDLGEECGYRECIDLNECENISEKPLEYKECPICVSNWKCTEFAPEKCPETEKRTRTCTDLNECGTENDMPPLTENCERKTNLVWFILGMCMGIAILLTIILLTGKDKNLPNNPSNQPPRTYPSVPPTQQHLNVQQKGYRKDLTYPSKLEQGYASNQTPNFKSPAVKPDNQNNRYPENY